MGSTAPTEKQENRVWVAQGKSTILCHYGLLTALMKLIRTISSSPSSCCSSTPPPRRPQYPEMYTGSNEVWGDVTMLTITVFSLGHIMLLVFATLISPSPSIRCSFIYHSLDAAIVFSRIVDSVYLVWIHNGWWFSYLVIWFGPSEGRNDKAAWLWPSSRPNQMDLILIDYCTWQFLVSLTCFWLTRLKIDLTPLICVISRYGRYSVSSRHSGNVFSILKFEVGSYHQTIFMTKYPMERLRMLRANTTCTGVTNRWFKLYLSWF